MKTPAGQLSVLVVDDDEVDRELICRTLRRTKLEARVQEACDVAGSLPFLASGDFDVALIDYRLPGYTGRDLLNMAPRDARGELTPMILLTGINDVEVAKDCINAGAQDYLIKSELDPSGLERSIRHAIERASLEEALRARVRMVEQQQAELAEANRALAEKNRELRLFTSAAAHDLSAPVRRVRVFAGMLLDRCGSELGEDGVGYLKRLTGSAETIHALIEGLLVLAEITEKERVLSEVDLSVVAREVAEELLETVERVGVVEIGQLPRVEGEPSELRRLLHNLIGNGLKYRDPDRTPVVRVGARRVDLAAGVGYHVEVEDNGIGFEPQYAARIFEPFKRLHGDGTFRGTGLGLAICQKVAQSHGGEISAESEPGVGSRFRVTLPVQQLRRAA